MQSLLLPVLFLCVGSLMLASCLRAAGASPWSMRAWQTDDGLPENNVTGVAQAPDGYLWVATHAGLARFDGLRFQLQPSPLGSGRNNPLIRAFELGQGGTVWVALEADRGLVVGFSPTATNIYTASDGLPGFKPLVLTQTSDGSVWVGYVDGSVCRISGGRVTRFGPAEGLAGVSGCWLATDPTGSLWFAKAGNVGVFTGRSFEKRFSLSERVIRMAAAREGGMWICAGRSLCKSPNSRELISLGELPSSQRGVEPSVLFEDRAGGLWIGTTAGGLFHWNGTELKAAETSHRDITSITQDREDNLWVGTAGGGVNRLRNRVLELHSFEAGLPFEAARSVCEDGSGRIWAVGANGALARQAGEGWETLSGAQGWGGARATCVASDRADGVWIGTYQAGLFHWRGSKFERIGRNEGLGGENVRALLMDSHGNLWLGLESPNSFQRLQNGRLTTLSQPPGSRTVRALAEDARGNIWLGTSDGILCRVEGDTLVAETGRALQPTKPIRALHADADGGLWIAYAGAGAGWLRDGKFSCFGREAGLLDTYISGIESSEVSTLWFSSGHGVFQVNRRDLETANPPGEPVLAVDVGPNESLPNLQGSYGYAPTTARARDGRLWFATRSGLVVATPARAQPSRLPPPVLIERVLIDGSPAAFSPAAVLRVSPGHRRLEIEFTAFNFASPESILFKHRLVGWDEHWSTPSTQRQVTYSRLAGGDYRLHIAARNAAGVWNQDGASLRFRVDPFLWDTWWFRSLLGAGLVLLLTWGIRIRERHRVRAKLAEHERQRGIERERARIARDIHDELGTSLTQIGLLADVGGEKAVDVRETELGFAKIAARARQALQSLDEIVWAANPRNDYLPRLADYLCYLADDAVEDSGLRCRKEVPTGLPPVPVGAELRHNLALAVKEVLANSLKHAQATTIRLRLEWRDPELEVAVEDDGKGFNPAQPSLGGNGLGNQAARMREIGGCVEMRSTPGKGTWTVFRVSLRGK
jgi:signal transduction histidine kinase/ligand-binding sensor domain-containing protein